MMTALVRVKKLSLAADLLCIFLLGFVVLLIAVLGQPRKTGFHCDNAELYYPFKTSTVSNFALILSSLFLPNAVIILVNLKWSLFESRTICKKAFLSALLESYGPIALFWMGVGFTQITVDTAKNSIGRLRPHFMSVCKPNINCTETENLGMYITKYECTNFEPDLIKNSRSSFPSGHAALAFYSAVYMSIYLKQKNSGAKRNAPVTTAVIQICLLEVAWFTSLSRVSDYMHHWTDVLAGAMTGAAFAYFVITYVPIPNDRLISIRNDENISRNENIKCDNLSNSV